jgi:hypothetical protein
MATAYSAVNAQSFNTVNDMPQHVEESRSYSPYLIEYHQDTETFTYIDPWVEKDQEHDTYYEYNDSNNNYNNNNNNDTNENDDSNNNNNNNCNDDDNNNNTSFEMNSSNNSDVDHKMPTHKHQVIQNHKQSAHASPVISSLASPTRKYGLKSHNNAIVSKARQVVNTYTKYDVSSSLPAVENYCNEHVTEEVSSDECTENQKKRKKKKIFFNK